MFSENTCLQPNKDWDSTVIQDEVVLTNSRTDAYYSLSGTAASAWKALKSGGSLQTICATLEAEYAVDGETCRRDVSDLLQQLIEHKLIHAVEA